MVALTVVDTSDSDSPASYSSAAEWQQQIQWWCSVSCDGIGVVCFRGHDIAVACISVESLGSVAASFFPAVWMVSLRSSILYFKCLLNLMSNVSLTQESTTHISHLITQHRNNLTNVPSSSQITKSPTKIRTHVPSSSQTTQSPTGRGHRMHCVDSLGGGINCKAWAAGDWHIYGRA